MVPIKVRNSIHMKWLLFAIITLLILAGLVWLVFSTYNKHQARLVREQAAKERKYEEVKVTLIEGWTNTEVYNALEKAGLGIAQEYTDAEKVITKSDYPFLADNPKGAGLIGFLFPDTYRLAKNSTADNVLTILLNTFEQKFTKASEGVRVSAGYYIIPNFDFLKIDKRTAPGLTVYDIVTLASIVEKETGRAGEGATSARLQEERQIVAGIFLNRLNSGIALQSDATVNFITKAGMASPTYDQTKVDSPYNTYKYAGLPPGPIANVSYSSLYAVLHPIKTNYLYFLHSQTGGEVYYATTYEDHLRNKVRYLK